MTFHIYEGKDIQPAEFADLMAAVGWGAAADYDPGLIQRSLAAYPFIAYARDGAGRLVGYISAFSDGAFSTFVGELVVHPDAQHAGLGTELLRRVEQRYPGVPVYTHAFPETEGFLARSGYRAGRRTQRVLFKIPA